MQIYIARGNERLGPFDSETVRTGLSNGTYSTADLAWCEGVPDWIPLSQIPGVTSPLPPQKPIPTVAPSTMGMAAAVPSALPAKKSRLGLYLGIGCGVTVLLALMLIGGCVLLVKLGSSAPGASQARYNPYKEALKDLFPQKVGDGTFNAIYISSSDAPQISSSMAASACQSGKFEVRALGIMVPVQLTVCNFPTAAHASGALKKLAAADGISLTAKDKGGHTVGQRYSGDDGRAILWTNGSLLCQEKATTSASAANFEKYLPY